MKKLLTRLFGVALVALLAAAAIPSLALADDVTVSFANGTSVITMTEGVEYDIGGGSAKLTRGSTGRYTLSLDAINLSGGAVDSTTGYRYAMKIVGDIDIRVKDINYITQTGAASSDAGETGLLIIGNPVFYSSGGSMVNRVMATAADQTSTTKDIESVGIRIIGEPRVNFCGIRGTGGHGAKASYGILITESLTVTEGYIEGYAGSVSGGHSTTPLATSAGVMIGGSLYAYSDTGMHCTGGTASATAESRSCGIIVAGDIECVGGVIQAEANTAVGNTGKPLSAGILSEDGGSVVFDGCKVIATSEQGDALSAGIYAKNTSVTFQGDSLDVTSFSRASYAGPVTNNYGIAADEGIEIRGGQVVAVAMAGGALNTVPEFGPNKYQYVLKAYSDFNDPDDYPIYSGDAKQAAREMGYTYTGNERIKVVASNDVHAIERLWGDWAPDTAAAISEYTFGTSTNVIIARDDDFADAMSASGLAGALDCPIILTNYGELTQAAADEISRLHAEKAYIIGGKYAIEQPVEDALVGMGLTVERVYGTACWDTSVACANKIAEITGNAATTDVIVAQSCNFQDALSISPLAYKYCLPIYLEKNSGAYDLPAEAIVNIQATDGAIWVPGGPYAVGTDTVEDVFGPWRVHRIYGTTGYDTSNQLATYLTFFGYLDTDAVCIANGTVALGGCDALAGSSLAGKAGCPLLLVSAQPYYEALNYTTIEGTDSQGDASYLAETVDNIGSPNAIYLLGGGWVLPQEFEDYIHSLCAIPFG